MTKKNYQMQMPLVQILYNNNKKKKVNHNKMRPKKKKKNPKIHIKNAL